MTKAPTKKKQRRKPAHYAASKSVVDPIVVNVIEAMRMGCWGRTKLFELIAARELESYLDGRDRRVIVKSIHNYIARKLQESGNTKTAQPVEAGSAP